MIRIGPAGNSESFTAMGYKSTPQIPEYLEKMGLNTSAAAGCVSIVKVY